MLLILFMVAWLLGTLALCIVFHELGHFAYFYYLLKKKIRIRVKKVKGGLFPYKILAGESSDYDGLSWRHYRSMTAWGVFAGFIPIILLIWPLVDYNVALFVLLLYVLGCVKDIKMIKIATQELKNE